MRTVQKMKPTGVKNGVAWSNEAVCKRMRTRARVCVCKIEWKRKKWMWNIKWREMTTHFGRIALIASTKEKTLMENASHTASQHITSRLLFSFSDKGGPDVCSVSVCGDQLALSCHNQKCNWNAFNLLLGLDQHFIDLNAAIKSLFPYFFQSFGELAVISKLSEHPVHSNDRELVYNYWKHWINRINHNIKKREENNDQFDSGLKSTYFIFVGWHTSDAYFIHTYSTVHIHILFGYALYAIIAITDFFFLGCHT